MGETKLTKGSYGYIDNWKRTRLITLALWVIFIGALLLIPMMVLGTKYNAFTVAAIVMVLPAARPGGPVYSDGRFSQWQPGRI